MRKVNIERLGRQLSKGKFHYVLLWGVIAWAMPVALVTKASLHFFGERSFFDGIVLWLIVFLISGVFYGIWLWSFQNKRYKKAKSENV